MIKKCLFSRRSPLTGISEAFNNADASRTRETRMTKADLSKYLEEHLGDLTHNQAAQLVEEILNIIKQTLAASENVKISGFGSFVVRDKHARQGRNPRTGEAMILKARRVVTFKASQILKEAVWENGVRK